jgi:protein-L-isoaspartate(D-aspartate) O-methyltransferase
MDLAEYWTTDDDSPSHVYHDVLIALDEPRGINNGQPSLWAYLFDRLDLLPGEQVLHLGCGTGYYTAIIAELVGSAGRVTAVEIDATLARRARAALADGPQVKVIQADGALVRTGRRDHCERGRNSSPAFLARRIEARRGSLVSDDDIAEWCGRDAVGETPPRAWICARFLCRAGFIDFQGARDPAISRRLAAALRRDQGSAVKSLRRDNHTEDETCWFHGKGWCL